MGYHYHASFNARKGIYEKKRCNAETPEKCPYFEEAIPGVGRNDGDSDYIDAYCEILNKRANKNVSKNTFVKREKGRRGVKERVSEIDGLNVRVSTKSVLKKMRDNGIAVNIASNQSEISFANSNPSSFSTVDILDDSFENDSTLEPKSCLRSRKNS